MTNPLYPYEFALQVQDDRFWDPPEARRFVPVQGTEVFGDGSGTFTNIRYVDSRGNFYTVYRWSGPGRLELGCLERLEEFGALDFLALTRECLDYSQFPFSKARRSHVLHRLSGFRAA